MLRDIESSVGNPTTMFGMLVIGAVHRVGFQESLSPSQGSDGPPTCRRSPGDLTTASHRHSWIGCRSAASASMLLTIEGLASNLKALICRERLLCGS